jgi:hypothetical protein
MVVLVRDLRMVAPVQEVRLALHRTVVPARDLHRMIIQDPALGPLHPVTPAPAPRTPGANRAQALQATAQALQATVALAQIHGVPLAPGQDPTTRTAIAAPQSSSTKLLPIPRHTSVSPKKPKQNLSNTRIQSRNLTSQKIPSHSRLRCIIRLLN